VNSTGAFSFDFSGTISQGITIISAIFQVDVMSSNGTPNIVFGCEDIDVASPPSSSNRPKDWTMTSDTSEINTAPANGAVTQIDITTAVQEVINRSSWDEEIINVFVLNNGGDDGDWWEVADTGHASLNPARLIIQYHLT
jgi:hypothetical protein